jgi:hypothetical protein
VNWKESKLVGVVAFVLMIGALAVIVLFTKSQMKQARLQYYLCSSTGEVFSVDADPTNREYVEKYIPDYGNSVSCKKCDKDDAFHAYRHPEGKWVKHGWTYLLCESTGKVFDTPTGEATEGYDPQYRKGPEVACLCKICDKEDAYEAMLDEKGNWIKSTAPEEPSGEVGGELPEPTPEEIGGIDGFIQREEARKAREAKEAAEREREETEAVEGEESAPPAPPTQDAEPDEEGAVETPADEVTAEEAAIEPSADETEGTASP